MAQTSAPLVGANMSDQDWRDLFGEEAGVVGDIDGSAYALTVPTDSDQILVGSTSQRSMARVGGFVHRIPANEPVSVTIPAASGSTRTDIIALRYDPTYTGSPGPVRLVVISGTSSGLPSYDDAAPGIEDLALWAITRSPGQALSSATRRQLYTRHAPVLNLTTTANLPTSAPLGTVARQGANTYHRIIGTSLVPTWVQYQFVQATAPTNAPDGALWFQVT